MTVAELCRVHGIDLRTFRCRLERGWNVRDALIKPVKPKRAKLNLQVPASTYRSRLKRGWDEERARTEPPNKKCDPRLSESDKWRYF